MANKQEMLAQYLLIDNALERGDIEALKKIVKTMIRELKTVKDEDGE